MAISTKSHKLLWSRAHDMCAMCRKPLTEVAEGHGLVLGEEAHIVAQRQDGPRGHEGDRSDIDGFDNLILLCADDHKRVDSDPERYPVDWLRAKKAEHESWAHAKFKEEPVRIEMAANEAAIPMYPVTTGEGVWDLVAGAAMYEMRSVRGDDDPDRSDVADEFLTTAREYGEISEAVHDNGFAAVREAQRDLQKMLVGLWERDMFAYGRRVSRTLKGGISEPMPFDLATLVILDTDELRERGGLVEPSDGATHDGLPA